MARSLPLIALYSPWPQCGKSSVAKLLVDAHNFQWVSFADPMRKMLVTFLMECGVSEDVAWLCLTDPIHKNLPIPEVPGRPTGRHLMRTIGTEWGRDCVTRELWVGIAEQRIHRAETSGRYGGVVVDDLRFMNEYIRLSQLQALKVHLVRNQSKPEDYDNIEARHPSDGALNDVSFDEVIDNSSNDRGVIVTIKNSLLARAQGLISPPDADGWRGPKATHQQPDGTIMGAWVRNGQVQWREIGDGEAAA
jgi:hypothetical protein